MALNFTKIPANTFSTLQLNAGVVAKAFDPTPNSETPNVKDADILGATSGGVNFSVVPDLGDRGEGIDNCPTNMKELRVNRSYDIKMSGTFVTISSDLITRLTPSDYSSGDKKVTPRQDLDTTKDFNDLWWVGDYGSNGMIAIHMINALSTGGFSIQSTDKDKGQIPFEFTAHYSMDAQSTVPYEIYISDNISPAAAAAAHPTTSG